MLRVPRIPSKGLFGWRFPMLQASSFVRFISMCFKQGPGNFKLQKQLQVNLLRAGFCLQIENLRFYFFCLWISVQCAQTDVTMKWSVLYAADVIVGDNHALVGNRANFDTIFDRLILSTISCCRERVKGNMHTHDQCNEWIRFCRANTCWTTAGSGRMMAEWSSEWLE